MRLEPDVQRVRRDVRVGNEDGELGEEDGQRGQGVLEIEQGAKVHPRAGRLVVRQALLDEAAGEEGGDGADEADDADGPAEPDARLGVQDDEREDDAACAAGRADDAHRQRAPLAEPLACCCDAGVEEERGREPAEDGECQEELVEF